MNYITYEKIYYLLENYESIDRITLEMSRQEGIILNIYSTNKILSKTELENSINQYFKGSEIKINFE